MNSDDMLSEKLIVRVTEKEKRFLEALALNTKPAPITISEAIRFIIKGWFMLTSNALINVIKTMPELMNDWDKEVDEFLENTKTNGASGGRTSGREEPPEQV